MNLYHVFEQSDAVLMATFLLLVGLSALSWYIIIYKTITLLRVQRGLQRFRTQYMQRSDWPLHLAASASATGIPAALIATTRTISVGDATQETRMQEARIQEKRTMHLAQTLDMQRTRMEQGMTILASVGSASPFIGLFGTVWGIYGALTHISASGNASLHVVAAPMGEALVATAIGLFAAIPAVLAYNAFVRRIRLLMQEGRHIAEHLACYGVSDIAPERAHTAYTQAHIVSLTKQGV